MPNYAMGCRGNTMGGKCMPWPSQGYTMGCQAELKHIKAMPRANKAIPWVAKGLYSFILSESPPTIDFLGVTGHLLNLNLS